MKPPLIARLLCGLPETRAAVAAVLWLPVFAVPFLLLPRTCFATVPIWFPLRGDDTLILNVAANHGRMTGDVALRSRYIADTLAVVRRDLVKQKKIEDLPVVIQVDPGGGNGPRVAREPNVAAIKGEEAEALGPGYRVQSDGDVAYERLLPLLLTLPALSEASPALTAAKPVIEASKYAGLTRYHDPLWSSGSKHLVVARSTGGEGTTYELREPGNDEPRGLDPLRSDPATRPVWSPDGRYLAYASLDMVKIYDTQTERTATIPLAGRIPSGARGETLLAFTEDSAKLRFAGDTNLFSDYAAFAYDLSSGAIAPLSTGTERPEWAGPEVHRTLGEPEQREVTSPDRRYVAVIEDAENGSARVVIRSPNGAVADGANAVSPVTQAPPNPGLGTFPLIALIVCGIILVVVFVNFFRWWAGVRRRNR